MAQLLRLGLTDRVQLIDRYIPNEEVGALFSEHAEGVELCLFEVGPRGATVFDAEGGEVRVIGGDALESVEQAQAAFAPMMKAAGDLDSQTNALLALGSAVHALAAKLKQLPHGLMLHLEPQVGWVDA